VKEQVLVGPVVDKPEALVRDSLDSAFCHLSTPQKVPAALPEHTVLGLLDCKPAIVSGGSATINLD
jgi:hypothetical protein